MDNGKLIELNNGLRVLCFHKENFKTSSVRIEVFAGSLHEIVPASAHFFEHICFQGTKKFPSQKALNSFADINAVYKNAYTNQTETVFSTDGPELESVLELATQIAFYPLLTEECLEKERAAVIDEARSVQYSPGITANQKQWTALGGEKFARLVTGTIEQIENVTHKDLTAFHQAQYRPGNTLIVVCSNESTEKQLERVKHYTKSVKRLANSKPTEVNLNWLEHKTVLSLQKNELDIQSQTYIKLCYKLSEPIDYRTYLLEVTATNVMRAKAHEHIRQNLVLAYDAGCNVSYLNNRNFGSNENYQSLTLFSSVAGELANKCIEELKKIPTLAYDDTVLIQNKINNIRYSGALDVEANTIDSANTIVNSVQTEYEGVFIPSKFVDIVQSFSVEDIKQEIKKITQNIKLIQVTSPSNDVLKTIKA